MLDEQTRIIFTRKFEVIDLCGETIIYDFETGNYNVLLGTADVILEHVKDNGSIAEIADAITAIYEIDRIQCVQDISAFLLQLEEKKILRLERQTDYFSG